jgi:hypothetical protein
MDLEVELRRDPLLPSVAEGEDWLARDRKLVVVDYAGRPAEITRKAA